MNAPATTLRDDLLGRSAPVPTNALGRLLRTGRGALGVASLLGRSRRGDAIDLADVDALVARVGALKGVGMKLGQMVGYLDAGLPDDVQALLATLQTASPITPFDDVSAIIHAALGDRAPALLAGLAPTPIASASVGQVHRGTLPDGTPVAVKVCHPGIRRAFEADFRTAALGRFIGAAFGASHARTFIDEARAALLDECDLALEAERQARFATLFDADPDLVVPAVARDWSTDAVLVTRWLPGASLADHLAGAPDQAARDRAGAALFRFWVRTLYRDGLFHADPHPGNFAFTPDGRIVVYDYGCVRAFEPALRRALGSLARATRDDDLDGMRDAIAALGGRAPARPAAVEHMRRLMRGFFGPLSTPGPRAISADEGSAARVTLHDKRALLDLRLPGRLLFLFRLRFGLYAVLARLGAVCDWAALESEWAATA